MPIALLDAGTYSSSHLTVVTAFHTFSIVFPFPPSFRALIFPHSMLMCVCTYIQSEHLDKYLWTVYLDCTDTQEVGMGRA